MVHRIPGTPEMPEQPEQMENKAGINCQTENESQQSPVRSLILVG